MDAARSYLVSEAAVGPHLADQLLWPMALGGGGQFLRMPVTQHFESHVAIIGAFLSRKVVTENVGIWRGCGLANNIKDDSLGWIGSELLLQVGLASESSNGDTGHRKRVIYVVCLAQAQS
jgi:hypothetical protein